MGWSWPGLSWKLARGLARGVFCCLNLWGLRIVSGAALTPLGGRLGFLQRGQGGPVLSNAGQGGQGRAGEPLQGKACVPVFKAGAQAWTGSPAGQGRYGWGLGKVVGGCVAAQGPQASCRETTSQPQASPRETLASSCQLAGPWACCRISRRLARNRGHLPANVKEQ